jgi:hypothetical protein
VGRLRVATALAVLLAGPACLAGCSDTAITDTRLAASVAPTFAHLWVLQQQEQGHPHPAAAAVDARAACHRSDPAAPARGAAPDWVCSVTWRVDGPGARATALYTVGVKTDGCYTADGDGPASLNGSAVLATARGTAPNPLYRFDSCFPAG